MLTSVLCGSASTQLWFCFGLMPLEKRSELLPLEARLELPTVQTSERRTCQGFLRHGAPGPNGDRGFCIVRSPCRALSIQPPEWEVSHSQGDRRVLCCTPVHGELMTLSPSQPLNSRGHFQTFLGSHGSGSFSLDLSFWPHPQAHRERWRWREPRCSYSKNLSPMSPNSQSLLPGVQARDVPTHKPPQTLWQNKRRGRSSSSVRSCGSPTFYFPKVASSITVFPKPCT